MNKQTTMLFTLLVLSVLVACTQAPQEQANKLVTVGFVAPLTGEAATYGIDEKTAVMLAVEDINKEGGINRRPLQIVFEDDQCTPAKAVTSVKKLLEVDNVKAVLGSSCSGATLAVAPVTEQARAILFTTIASNAKIRNAGDYVFRNLPGDDLMGSRLAAFAKKYTSVALLSETTEFAQGLRDVFKATAATSGLAIVADETFPSDSQDYRTQLAKIKEAGPAVLFVNPQADPAGGRIIKQARELGIQSQILLAYWGSSKTLQETAGLSNAEGMIWADVPAIDPQNAREQELIARATKIAVPTFPSWIVASYDRVRVLGKAMSACNGDSPDCVRDWMYKMPSYTGVGGTFSFDKDGEVVGISHSVFQLKDGKTVKIE